MKVGFIGLGRMGAGMALNLRKAGYELVVFDLNREAVQPLLDAGASAASSVAELGRVSDVVFTSLPAPKQMREVGEELLTTLRSGSTWFDLTTNAPSLVKEMSLRFKDKGIAVLDVPVSGQPAGASSGKLALYVGGDRAAYDQHKSLLDAMGDRVMYVGDVGAGGTAKLVHNLIALIVRMAIAEGMSLGVKAGLDPVDLWYAVRQGATGRSRTLDAYAENYLESRYDPPGFALELAHKDFTLALDLAHELGVPMDLAETAYKDFNTALARGWGQRDSRAPMELQNERAGITVKADPARIKAMLDRG
jgi:3-hydroxyisobutyrate dehydrogenase